MTLFDYMGEAKRCSRCNDCHWDVLAEECPKEPCYTCEHYPTCKKWKEPKKRECSTCEYKNKSTIEQFKIPGYCVGCAWILNNPNWIEKEDLKDCGNCGHLSLDKTDPICEDCFCFSNWRKAEQ